MRLNSAALLAGLLVNPAGTTAQVVDLDDVSGLEIRRDNSAVIMGVDGDVVLSRSGDSEASLSSNLLVKGLDVSRAAANMGAGGVGWQFTHPTKHYLQIKDLTLPDHWTIEFWVNPQTADDGKYFLSFATGDDNDCMRLQASGFSTTSGTDSWHRIVVTWDRRVITVYDNGEPNMDMLTGDDYCQGLTGTLAIGHEQDSVDGDFSWDEATPLQLDTLAIYRRAFSLAERKNADKTCVDMTDPDLVHLYSGYTRGNDQIGQNHGSVTFKNFVEGASVAAGAGACTNDGAGAGTPGDDYSDSAITHVTPAVGAVGWVFPGGSTGYHLLVSDFTYPPDWTMEMWVYPLELSSSKALVSFATTSDNNCFILWSKNFPSTDAWYHVVITYDGEEEAPLVYIDGELDADFLDTSLPYCGELTGSLSIGQEQDSVNGGYDANQASSMILDTLAVYSSAWSDERIAEEEVSPCIDLGASDLYALYSGSSGGTDLVGKQDGIVTASEIVSPGDTASTQAGDVLFDVDACEAAQDQVDASAPTFDNSLVGGVAWDFPGDSVSYYFASPTDFSLPDAATIELWAYPRTNDLGFLFSWAGASSTNCIIASMSATFDSDHLNQWNHVVMVIDDGASTAAIYVNGENTNNPSFCGDRTGSLTIAQEQDSLGGGFVARESANVIIDTVAVYSTAFASSDIASDTPVGVDLTRQDLYALYSGVTRGKDLVGHQDSTVWAYQISDGANNPDSNIGTLDMLSPRMVGGVGWEFPGSSVDYYLATDVNSDFALPSDEFTIETWAKVDSDNSGYWMSYAVDSSDNCLLMYMDKWTSDLQGSWHHVVVTYDGSSTTFYLDGTVNNDFIHSGFCGSSGPGSLVMTQEQDDVGGGFSASQSAGINLDTVAIYTSAWSADDVAARQDTCVDLHDPSLMTVWSGFTRGKDLVGNNDAILVLSDWIEGSGCNELS